MPTHTYTHVPALSTKTTPSTLPAPSSPIAFTLTTPPGTDIWRPSASATTNRFDAPYTYTSIRSGAFRALTCTISGAWESKFDQGGILMLWPASSGRAEESKWMKAGVEFFEGRAALSVVGCDRVSDWSLSPTGASEGDGATIRVERDGTTLWVFVVEEGGRKRALREIKWAWMEGREADAELWVGVCAAKPAEGEGERELEVEFRDWRLEVEE